MRNDTRIVFEPFCLDQGSACLWKGSQAIKLRPKAFAVLDYLLHRPGQLVVKEELLNAVWSGTFVGEAVLKVVIRQIRDALEDDPRAPRFIETAHRRGYRFIGHIGGSVSPPKPTAIMLAAAPVARVVGREAALERLQGWMGKMQRGERQIVFVTGEAGIGKTSLVDTFAQSLVANQRIRRGRGQCLEQYGTSEAYLPVLEAVGRLCREQAEVVDVLRAHAPMWLLQMPSLVSATERERLSREVSGATRERMLREMSDALEVLTGDRPLVLILEDLHWSDYSTLDLISYLARQRQPAQLMLIGTYRTAELIVSGHPLKAVKQELLAKQQCEELPLEYLNELDVASYLSARFPGHRFPPALATLIHRRTEGNPLFMVNAVDYLEAESLIDEGARGWELVVAIENVDVGVPDSIRHMIEKQLDHLTQEQQQALEAASAAGSEFSALALAAGLQESLISVEARCDTLARQRHFIRDVGVQELADGSRVSRYGFIHALYQNVLYDRLTASRRVQLHRRIGESGEQAYGEHAGEIAAELAMHFERGAHYRPALRYLQQAAENGVRRFAYREAVALARRGLELVPRLPDSEDRAGQELALLITLGVPLIALEGYAAPDVGQVYRRARELCHRLGDTEQIPQALWGLWSFYLVKAELGTTREIAEEFLRLNARLPYGEIAMEITLMHLGEFSSALKHAENAVELYDPKKHRNEASRYSQNPMIGAKSHGAWTLWFLGEPDRALAQLREVLAFAQELSDPHGLAHALFFSATLHQLRQEPDEAQQSAEAAIAVARQHGILLYETLSRILLGWALVENGQTEKGIAEIREGFVAQQPTGIELLRPQFLALLAQALVRANQTVEGLRLVEEALAQANRNSERYYLAELYRLKGEMLLQLAHRTVSGAATIGKPAAALPNASRDAEECIRLAVTTARKQGAKSLELRAAVSLARIFQRQGKLKKGRDLLVDAYANFTEGFGTRDLKDAKALLQTLA